MKNLFEVRKNNKVVQEGFEDKQEAKKVRDELNGRKEDQDHSGPHTVARGKDHMHGASQ